MHGISAAHPTMPLPSYARVTNLENGRSIVVRVNDRGPYARNRIIDLSIGTAKALKFYGQGLARVRVEYVGRAPIDGSDDTACCWRRCARARRRRRRRTPVRWSVGQAVPVRSSRRRGSARASPIAPRRSSSRAANARWTRRHHATGGLRC